ncbi:hypothetical protein [Enterococcus wangshanyuanii]|uniref:LXG domain-containing protein n=1 Tax=Enterococcus wangshanyuanii TaxID=2005703 RepID=A0ABQ1NZZ1_9ENTE|nr:hypothetical protein [Enterococcus wangshanyuanii]GGC87552.1 hypothetical protein GCM10011573_16510 [Enterococcus wangshanyuanii]
MVKMIIGDVQTQTEEIKAFGQFYSQALDAVSIATQGIQLAVGLSGAGMESIKGYLSTVYPALCKAAIMHSEAVVQANERYVQGYLSTCGSEDLDSEELQAQIDEANALIQDFQRSKENYAQQKRSLSDEKEQLLGAVFEAAIASMDAGITRNQAKKAKIQEKLEKFLDFCGQSTSYFTGIKDTGSLVAKGMQALGVSEKGHVGPGAWNEKGFSLTDRTWINNVNQNWTKREKAIEVKDRKILDGCTIIHIIDADRGVDIYMFEKNGHRYPVSEQDLSDNLRKLIKKYNLDVVELSPTEMDRRVIKFQKSGKDYFSGDTVNIPGFQRLNHIQSTVNDLKESGFWDAAWGVGLTVAAVRNAQTAGKKSSGTNDALIGSKNEKNYTLNKSKNTGNTSYKKVSGAKNVIKNNLGKELDITPSKAHTKVNKNPGPFGKPNSSVDILDSKGELTTRRFYDGTGKAVRDVDMTNHGNPKRHPEYPHEHKWKYDSNGKPTRE